MPIKPVDGVHMNFEGGYVMPKMAIGAFISYHTNNKYIDRQTLMLRAIQLLRPTSNIRCFTYPFGLLAKYRFTTDEF